MCGEREKGGPKGSCMISRLGMKVLIRPPRAGGVSETEVGAKGKNGKEKKKTRGRKKKKILRKTHFEEAGGEVEGGARKGGNTTKKGVSRAI